MSYSKGSIILAGGESSRIGSPKPLTLFRGKPLIAHVIDKITLVVSEIIIAISKDMNPAPFEKLGGNVQVTFDGPGDRCPLRGFKAGLNASETEYIILLPCDTPFLKTELVEYLFNAAQGSNAAIPLWENGYLEPLCAVYNTNYFKKILNSDTPLSMRETIMMSERLKYVPVSELKRIDPSLLSFFNINTTKDLERAENAA